MKSLIADSEQWRKVALAYVLLFVAAMFVYSLYSAKDTWDMLGYAGSVASLESSDPATVHAIVYDEFKAHASAEEFEAQTAETEYRKVMASDAEAFWQQIPYYKIRVLYIFLLFLLSKVGVGVFEGIHFLTAAFTCAGLLCVYFSVRHHIHSLFWFIFPIMFYQFGEDFNVFIFGGVDSFAFFWVALTCALFLRKSSWLLPVLALSVLVRTDLLVHVLLLCCSVLWLQRDLPTLKKVITCFVVAFLLYLGINHWAENYGWSTLFYFAHVSDMSATHPLEFANIPVTLDQIITAYLTPEWITKWFWLAVWCAVLSWVMYLVMRPLNGEGSDTTLRLGILGAVGVAYVVAHYLLFPGLYMRFFIAQCSFMVLALFGIVTFLLRSKISRPQP